MLNRGLITVSRPEIGRGLLSDCENRWIVCSSSPHTAAAAVPTSHSASPLPSPTFLIYGCFGGCGFYDIVVIIIRTKSGIMDPTPHPPSGGVGGGRIIWLMCPNLLPGLSVGEV